MTIKHSNKKLGILLINIGSPNSPSEDDVREFLSEFLQDPNVVDYPSFLWKPILNGIILKKRPRKSALLYKSIWQDDGSPIISITNTIAVNLSKQKQDWLVRSGMRYGNPSIQDALKEMADSEVEHLVILPLFPQYSLTTSKTIIDKVNQLINSKHRFPLVTVISDYHQHPAYIHALSETLKASWQSNGRPEKTVFSFHGVPQRYISKKGSPYHAQCLSTVRLIADNLKLSSEEYVISFQSRFGPEKWLLPNTKDTLAELGAEKVKHLNIICPGFAADCLETLEEINIGGREVFQQNGGNSYQYIAALNHQELHIQALIKIIKTAIN